MSSKDYGIGMVIVTTVAIVIFIFVITVSGSRQKGNHGSVFVSLHNTSSLDKKISFGSKTVFLPKNSGCDPIKTTVPLNTDIMSRAENVDGTPNMQSLFLTPGQNFTDIYFTEGDIHTNLSCRKGSLVNDSNNPVLFIELGSAQRRWPKHLLSPGQVIDGVALPDNSTWQVSNPERDDQILASTKISRVNTLKFDGSNLVGL